MAKSVAVTVYMSKADADALRRYGANYHENNRRPNGPVTTRTLNKVVHALLAQEV